MVAILFAFIILTELFFIYCVWVLFSMIRITNDRITGIINRIEFLTTLEEKHFGEGSIDQRPVKGQS